MHGVRPHRPPRRRNHSENAAAAEQRLVSVRVELNFKVSEQREFKVKKIVDRKEMHGVRPHHPPRRRNDSEKAAAAEQRLASARVGVVKETSYGFGPRGILRGVALQAMPSCRVSGARWVGCIRHAMRDLSDMGWATVRN
jgi:hypothetical protein